MKIKKLLILSLFLIIGMLLFIPNAVNASSTIDEVILDFEGAVPIAGETPKEIVIKSEKYEIVYQEWCEYDASGHIIDDKVTTFEYGKTYDFDMYIKVKEGYTYPLITTKNINWDDVDDIVQTIVTNSGNKYYDCLYFSGDYTTGTVNENVKIPGNQSIIPIIGKAPQYLDFVSEEYEIASQDWYDEDLNKVTTFEAGKTYNYIISLKHKTAYGWDGQSSIEVNNIDWMATYAYSEVRSGTLYFAGTLIPVEEFEIKVESDEGVRIGQDGPLVVPKGYGRNLHILAEDGYKITSVKVNGVEQTLPLANDNLSLNNIQEDINVVVEAEIEDNDSNTGEVPALKQINLTEDSINQEFNKGTDEFLAFTLINNGGSGKVFIDGIELNKDNGDYGWGWNESFPYIKISETYLTKLKSGKHTIKFVIDDNAGEAETTFTIVEPEDKENNKGDNNNTNNENANTEENNSINPQTGDNIMVFVAILGIATIGIVVTTRLKKRLKNN